MSRSGERLRHGSGRAGGDREHVAAPGPSMWSLREGKSKNAEVMERL